MGNSIFLDGSKIEREREREREKTERRHSTIHTLHCRIIRPYLHYAWHGATHPPVNTPRPNEGRVQRLDLVRGHDHLQSRAEQSRAGQVRAHQHITSHQIRVDHRHSLTIHSHCLFSSILFSSTLQYSTAPLSPTQLTFTSPRSSNPSSWLSSSSMVRWISLVPPEEESYLRES